MGEPVNSTLHDTLLSNGYNTSTNEKMVNVFKSVVKCILKSLMWMVFVAWITLIFIYPSEFGHDLALKLIYMTQGSLFGVAGSTFLAFSAPVLIVAFLGVLYLIVSGEDEVQEKRSEKRPSFRLWTFPILVDSPFGVVTAAEFIGIILIAAFVIWAFVAYLLQSWSLASQSQLPVFEKISYMFDHVGAKLGLIGLFCLAFLFLPVSRGSVLLRVIDIPFEHATRYHVWLGHLTMWLFTLHGLFFVICWAMEGRLAQEIFQWKDIGVAHLAGVISLLSGLLMWVTSLEGVRKWNFELFFYTHQLYLVFVVFFAMHAGDFVFCFAAGGIFIFILDRFLRFVQSRKSVDIISATSLPCGTLELVVSKPACLRYNALSFIFLQVRGLSRLQWHPFSVSSSPLDGKHHLSILIKVLGEWTEKLKATISNNPNEPQMLQHSHLRSLLTASVEGPYGHESPYYLTYKHLVLVAGGIGISPFLAILGDIFNRIKEGKPCTPSNILIIWAIKKSDELPILSMLNMEYMDPVLFDALNLEIQIYITRESQPEAEDRKNLVIKPMNSCKYPASKRSGISVLVGTGDNLWAGIYIIAPSIGFMVFLGLLDEYYINPKGIDCLWYKGLLLMLCMVAGVVIVGGLVVSFWHLWERRMLACEEEEEEHDYDQNRKSNEVAHCQIEDEEKQSSCGEYIVNSSTILYGCRPDFNEILGSRSEKWGAADVGVLVCGPSTLQSSVACVIRSHSLTRRHHHPVFHFNTHTFDL